MKTDERLNSTPEEVTQGTIQHYTEDDLRDIYEAIEEACNAPAPCDEEPKDNETSVL